MLRKNFTLTNQQDEIIRGEIRHREDAREAPCIIICHGFKGFKDWGFFPTLAESLANSGYVAITFNFSRNGLGADLFNFTEPDKFARNTYSHEIKDLDIIVSAVKNGKLGKGLINTESLGLLGHSRGGGITLLYAAHNNGVHAVVTWAAIANVNRFTQDDRNYWQTRGYIEVENKRTNQIMRINRDLYDDLEQNKDYLDILSVVGNLDIPILVIHGEIDESVPCSEGQKIFDAIGSQEKEYMVIESGTHTFGISHPMQLRSQPFDAALDLTENWFDRYLNP